MKYLQNTLGVALFCLLLTLSCADAQPAPGPGPGPGGGGPIDPPRSTPGLDPVTLSGIAAFTYAGYRFYKGA